MPKRLSNRDRVAQRLATVLVIAALLGLCVSIPRAIRAETATDVEMETVCHNWLSYMIHEKGSWAGEINPAIAGSQDITEGETVLARCFLISPRGHVVVPVLKELPPIKAYSEEYGIDVNQRIGYPQLLREILQERIELYIERYGSLTASQPSTGDVLLGREHREEWDRFLVAPPQFLDGLRQDGAAPMTEVGPLLTTDWHQSSPYNNDCPMGDGGQCVVGCVATATAQVLRYHEWPPTGIGWHQYYWNGDYSCGGSTDGEWLYADFADPYDWANMPDDCNGGCTPTEEAALAELCSEVGISFNMSYGACGSGAYTSDAVEILPAHFRYDSAIDVENRGSHSLESWFAIIKEEINNGRPMLYSFRYSQTSGHAIVCDGWRDTGGLNQYHMNYGWGGAYTGWYTLDNIYHDYNYGEDSLIRRIMPGTGFVFEVHPDGSGYYPTIQAAIDGVLDGDIIQLTNGTYTGAGNRDIDFHGKSLTVRSRDGNPGLCIMDCQGNPENHRGFTFLWGEDNASVVEGITIRNGYFAGSAGGGAIHCANGSSPMIRNCVIEQSVATDPGTGGNGGGVACANASPTLIDCVFYANQAADPTDDGGGLYCSGSSPTLNGCIFSNNSAGDRGGGIAAVDGAHPILTNCTFNENAAADNAGGGIWISSNSTIDADNTIIAFGFAGGAVGCEGGTGATLACCDVYGNTGGDWGGCIANQYGVNGNISLDPLFCDQETEDFHLQAESPCDAAYNPGCGLIGALPLGCSSYIVSPDGSGDYPTIQAAIDGAVDGDLIELTDGIFSGSGNRDIDYGGRRITIRSQSGDPVLCIIDCEGTDTDPHRGFNFHSAEWADARLEGVTITNGYTEVYSGGAISCTNNSNPTITNCVLKGNYAGASGGGLYISGSQPTISYCTIVQNESENGGGVRLHSVPSITLRNCTISDNAASDHGGGVYCFAGNLTMENCIVAFSSAGESFYCYYSDVDLSCCDIFGNEGGDWTSCIAGQENANGNMCENPMFCNASSGDYHIDSYSPCAPGSPPDAACGLIGAWPVGCALGSVDENPLAGRELYLAPGVPNPFGRTTMITYAIPSAGGAKPVRLGVHDAAGRLVRSLVDTDQPGGAHHVRWDGRNDRGEVVAGGVYFYRLFVKGEERTKQVVLIR